VKLTIYPKADYLPLSKEDKIRLSHLASNPNLPEVVEIANDEQLIAAVTTYGWSPSIFYGFRHNDNFVSADFMSLDVDSGLTIAEAEKRAQGLGLACLCLPSPSYTEEFEKFRLVFPLAKTILNREDFDQTWDWLQEQFPELDAQCSDYARWFCKSTSNAGFYQDGEFLVPKKAPEKEPKMMRPINEVQIEVTEDIAKLVEQIYGNPRQFVPESVEFFIKNAHTGLEGLWTNSLNACCFSLALSGVDDTIIEELVEQIAPEPLSKSDLYQIKRALRDGKANRQDL
jgi:hypothetical protein